MQYALAVAALVGAAAAMPASEWEPVKTTTTTEWEPVKKTTTTTAWEPVKPTDCTYTKTYTTKEWKDEKKTAEWDAYEIVTKTIYKTTDVCTWGAWPEETPAPKPTWAPAPAPEKKCEATYTYYTTKEWKDEKKTAEWDAYEIVTKTKTVYPEYCTTWNAVPVKPTETWVPVKETTTWAPAPAPVKPTSTWVDVKVTPSAVKVASYTGAADKNTLGMGALAIAAVAALL